MRLFILTSMIFVGCSLAGCAGELQDTKVELVKSIQSVAGTGANPTVAPQQEGAPGTAPYTVLVSITIEPGQVPDGDTDGQEKAAQ